MQRGNSEEINIKGIEQEGLKSRLYLEDHKEVLPYL